MSDFLVKSAIFRSLGRTLGAAPSGDRLGTVGKMAEFLIPNPPIGRSRAGQIRDERRGKQAVGPRSLEIRLGVGCDRRRKGLLTTAGRVGGRDQLADGGRRQSGPSLAQTREAVG